MNRLRTLTGLGLLAALSTTASAQLIDLRIDLDETTDTTTQDGVLGANEYGAANSHTYGGGGSGFGGTVGAGALYLDFDAANLNVGFQAGANVNDLVVILIDSRAGGFTDAAMSDTADGGRAISTNLTRDSDDQFFSTFLPDYSIVIGNFGIVSFELTSGSLNFIDFDGSFTGNAANFREYDIARTALSLGAPGAGFDFIVGYGSGDNFMSNESMPGQAFNAGGNLGYGSQGGTVLWEHYDRFEAVPEPGTMLALGAGLAAFAARRRRK